MIVLARVAVVCIAVVLCCMLYLTLTLNYPPSDGTLLKRVERIANGLFFLALGALGGCGICGLAGIVFSLKTGVCS